MVLYSLGRWGQQEPKAGLTCKKDITGFRLSRLLTVNVNYVRRLLHGMAVGDAADV
jgi:hypothetical protein